MIELKYGTKRYESLTAVDDVSFSVKAGEYFALLGPNGAWKTTIVKMLLDFTRPTSGSLSLYIYPLINVLLYCLILGALLFKRFRNEDIV